MWDRTLSREKRAQLARAQEIANETATVFYRARRVKSGANQGAYVPGAPEYLKVTTARQRANALAKGYRPRLSSSQWREVYALAGKEVV